MVLKITNKDPLSYPKRCARCRKTTPHTMTTVIKPNDRAQLYDKMCDRWRCTKCGTTRDE